MLASLLLCGLLCSSAPIEPATHSGIPAVQPEGRELYWSLALEDVAWADSQQAQELLELNANARSRNSLGRVENRVVLEGGCEGYLFIPKREAGGERPGARLVALSDSTEGLGGTLVYSDRAGFFGRVDFQLSASSASASAAEDFLAARRKHNRDVLRELSPAGSAWFRHQADAGSELGLENDDRAARLRERELTETFELFSGGRAVAENIQLDRLFPRRPTQAEDEEPKPDVAIGDIEGITVREFDWSAVIQDPQPADLDPLLTWIPSDQHVLITASMKAFIALVDELEHRASPLVAMMESSSSSVRSREAIERQLLFSLDALTRLLGPALIKNVAVTGNDLYMRTGTDITLILNCFQARAVGDHLRKQHVEAAAKDASLLRSNVDGIEGIASTFGAVSSYFVIKGDFVILSNSRASIERVLAAQAGENLAQLEETQFFRKRYCRGQSVIQAEETAFLMVSDATLRRWCGPKWRIAASHRIRALAALYELHAAHVEEIVRGVESARVLTVDNPRLPDLGVVTLHAGGVHSSRYGSIGNLTPIVEMELTKVSAEDARLYGQWRDGYANNWSAGFDPIAAQVAITDTAVEGDLTVMPLIDNNDYRDMQAWTGDAQLGPLDGDPHPGTLFHFAMAIDPDAPQVLELQGLLSGFASDEVSKFLSWMTGSLSFFADEAEVWDYVQEAEDFEEVFEELSLDINALPLALVIGSSSPLKLASWMSALRGFVTGSAPGLTAWTPMEDEEGHAYVKISADSISPDGEYLLYSTLEEALVFGLNTETLIASMKRFEARREGSAESEPGPASPSNPWLGESVGLSVSRQGIAVASALDNDSFGAVAQRFTFANLLILNEWKRLFPDQDPVDVHRRIMREELLCLAGGEFVWDDEWKTMASTAVGHPAAPKEVTSMSLPIGDLQQIDAGLTFEHDGLRARIRVQR